MTASEPTPETIDTIARAICDCRSTAEHRPDCDLVCQLAEKAASQLLSSTDPAVQRALATHQWHACPDVVLDTGTEAGVLHEEAKFFCSRGAKSGRYVTVWREVEQP